MLQKSEKTKSLTTALFVGEIGLVRVASGGSKLRKTDKDGKPRIPASRLYKLCQNRTLRA